MGNLVGERFDDFVNNQINARQSLAGKGFGEASLSNSQLLLLNNRNAWLKLASSVNIIDSLTLEQARLSALQGDFTGVTGEGNPLGTQRLIDIGIGAGEAPNFLGSQLAQKSVLFNTLSEVTPSTFKLNKESNQMEVDSTGSYNFRSGVSKTGDIWNSSNSYGLGGSNFGLTPSPGLISAKINCLGRGSIRTAEVEIKAYNQFQFEMLELVYLRLGFTMMLEWGWDKYTVDGKNITNVGNTLIEDHWFKNVPSSQLRMLNAIQFYREKYNGNYDGFFGKVVNFDWNFNKNGTYDIKLKLITVGDVIESLKMKPTSSPLTPKKLETLIAFNEENTKEKTRLEGFQKSTLVTRAGSSPLAQSLYVDIINKKRWDNTDNNYFSFNDQKDVNLEEIEGDEGDYININPKRSIDQYAYYMTFSTLLSRIEEYCIPSVGKLGQEKKQIQISYVGDDYLCSAYPNQISFNPKVCLIQPIFTNSIVKDNSTIKQWSWFKQLKPFGFLESNNKLLYGNLMNIYVNYDFISNCLSSSTNKDGNITIYKFLEKICDGINSSLGNFQQIEAIIRDDYYITIQDQNPIPGLELKYPDTAISNITPFEVFGFNTTGSSSSNFVTDFSFNTKITPQLATQVSIGTTANSISTKNYDGTAFSKWNSGLQDRFASSYLDPTNEVSSPTISNEYGEIISNLTSNQIDTEWEAFKNGEGDAYFITHKPRPILPDISLTIYGKVGNASNMPDGKIWREIEKSPLTSKSYGTSNFEPPLTWPQYISAVESDFMDDKARQEKGDLTIDEVNLTYKNTYSWYLIRAFSGKLPSDAVTNPNGTINPTECQYYINNPDFISEGKSVFNNYILSNNVNAQYNTTNSPANTIGYIPADVSLTFKGLSGIKIFQQLAIRQNFLPKQYPKALKFLIKGVDHSISNNDWSTNINTLSIPNVEAKLNLGEDPKLNNTLISDGLLNDLTPNATELRNYLRGGALIINNAFFEKGNEISNNGDISAGLKDITIELLKSLNKAISQISSPLKPIEIRITAGNDTSHSGSSSKHPKGNALDFTLGPPINPTWGTQLTTLKTYNINGKNIILPAGPLPKYPSSQYEYINLIDKAMMDFVKNNLGTNYINEYYNPSSGANGPHFHFSVRDNFVEI